MTKSNCRASTGSAVPGRPGQRTALGRTKAASASRSPGARPVGLRPIVVPRPRGGVYSPETYVFSPLVHVRRTRAQGAGMRSRPTSSRFTASPRVTRGFRVRLAPPENAVDGLHAPVRGPRRAAAAGHWHPAAKCAAAPARATSAITSAAISHPRQAARARRSSSSVVFISSSSVLSLVPLRSTCAAQAETSQFLLPSVQHAQFLSSYQPSGRYTPGPSYS